MTHRIPIDWDELEIALTMHMEEVSNYLDLRTGRVELAANELLGNDAGLSEEEVQTGFLKGYLIHIEPLSSSVEYGWMVEFAETVADRRLREKLDVALDGRGAFRRFKDVLADYPAERERWFAFHDTRLRQAMEEWLADHDIEPTTPPPRKKS
jgi:hypothetical protein